MADKTNLDITYINICQKNTKKTNTKKTLEMNKHRKCYLQQNIFKKNAIHSPT